MRDARLPHRCWTQLSLVLAIFLVVISLTNTAGAQLTPIDEEPGTEAPGLGDIIGSPEAGPDPEDAGDRGGWAQLALAGVLVGAVLFIGSRIRKEARAGRQVTEAVPARPPDASGNREL